LTARLSIKIANPDDIEGYLALLRSLESVLRHVQDVPDYVHPQLQPQPVVESRQYWKPGSDTNPMNAWNYQCQIESSNPVNTLLKGRTFSIKDNISIGGLPTTLGTVLEAFSPNSIPPASPIDASGIGRILSAGGIMKGSSTCENHCASPLSFTSATGPVHNPLLHGYTTDGSSSGSTALVSACSLMRRGMSQGLGDVAELSIGSDQGGSVRIPASYTGVSGLKPTFGLVPYTGAASMALMIDHLGPIALSLEDIATLLKVIAGFDGVDLRMTPESLLVSQVKDYPKILADFKKRSPVSQQEHRKLMRVGFLVESF
jgi:amidase